MTDELTEALGDFIAEQRDRYPRVADDMDSWDLAEDIAQSDWLADRLAVARAEALTEAANEFAVNTWADVVPPALKTTGLKSLAVTQAFVIWLRARAAAVAGDGEGL